RESERWIAFFIILSITLLVLILLIRYLNTKAKTDRLVQQIEEITELQLAQIEEVQLLERKRIGQELHDDLTASIAMATRYLILKADQSNDTSDKNQTMQVVKTLEESYNLTRMKSHRLFQEDNARQFCDRLAAETELLFVGTRIQFTFTGEISGLILSAEFKTTLVMVIKEAMTNIIKHANASQASIVLYYDQESLILEISDNGKGIATDRFEKGIGLKTVQNRIMSVGGTLTIHSAKPTGTTLEIRIPLPSEATHLFDDQ
ncbi:sensor histidine kinase, partial [Spirosoma sp.]|uniref:sensor histidine kinase n=1 Tax=Spirosoma sp. TaxID=1899569 RepID=UPI003B3ACF91